MARSLKSFLHEKIKFNMNFVEALTLVCLFILLLLTAYYRSTLPDEAFYLSVPYRLMRGDGLLTDEWHLSQLSAVLLYLPVKLFVSITGSTAGIILFFRKLFCLFQLSAAAIVYKLLKKEGSVAVIISGLFMFFIFITLPALSYNSLGFGLLLILCCLLYSKGDKYSFATFFFSGLLLAAYILCQPFGVIFFALYCLIFPFAAAAAKRKKHISALFTLKAFGTIILGILPVFIYFLILLFKNSDIRTIIKCFPYLFTDASHMLVYEGKTVLPSPFRTFFTDMFSNVGKALPAIASLSVAAAIFVKRYSRPAAVFISGAVCGLFFIVILIKFQDPNLLSLPPAFFGVACFAISKKKNYPAFFFFWCMGIIHVLLISVSSNISEHVGMSGFFISAAGSYILARGLANEFKEKPKDVKADGGNGVPRKTAALFLSILIISMGAIQIVTGETFSLSQCFALPAGHVRITQGAYKNIRLPSNIAIIVRAINRDMDILNEKVKKGKRIFSIQNFPFVYLETSCLPGTFSEWFVADEIFYKEAQERFKAYYKIFPENMPDYIYAAPYQPSEGIENVRAERISLELAKSLFIGNEIRLDSGILFEVAGLRPE